MLTGSCRHAHLPVLTRGRSLNDAALLDGDEHRAADVGAAGRDAAGLTCGALQRSVTCRSLAALGRDLRFRGWARAQYGPGWPSSCG
jgi:hypothetical protein